MKFFTEEADRDNARREDLLVCKYIRFVLRTVDRGAATENLDFRRNLGKLFQEGLEVRRADSRKKADSLQKRGCFAKFFEGLCRRKGFAHAQVKCMGFYYRRFEDREGQNHRAV